MTAQNIVIYGGTPGGIATAVFPAARLGREVTLIECHGHIGGMTTSGLGKSDIEYRTMIAREPKITVWKGWRLQSAHKVENKLRGITLLNPRIGGEKHQEAKIFDDATYEGDLYAASGSKFRLGRESSEAFGEPHAGVVCFDCPAHETGNSAPSTSVILVASFK